MTSRQALIRTARQLARDASVLEWRTPSHVYNPLQYAWNGHRAYLDRYGEKTGRVLLVGMNPGPWGMAQTGVPFGNISAVRDWFRIDTKLTRDLPVQHPKYPILGMHCHRDEGSGRRLWGWARRRFGEPDRFSDKFFVWNYCPLLFLAHNRNLPPSDLSTGEASALDLVCGRALDRVIATLKPAAVVGIGRYAERRLREHVDGFLPVSWLPHPSPANPAANRRWPELADHVLAPWLSPRR